MFSLIVARDSNGGIGKNGGMPWRYAADLKLFKELTTGAAGYEKNAVVMGYNTWESLPTRPLSNRLNIVISREHFRKVDRVADTTSVIFYRSLTDFLCELDSKYHYWIIGGKQIYEWFLANRLIADIYDTQIAADHDCDINLELDLLYRQPEWVTPIMQPAHIMEFNSANHPALYVRYTVRNGNFEEQQLLDTIKCILDKGSMRQERTGTGTLSIFGGQLRFDLSTGFPLMTCRPHSLRIIFEELMWILRGQRDVGILEKKNIHIWSANSTREFIDKQCLDIELDAGDIGESYGHNMRQFGAINYECCARVGFDQLANALYLLKNNPTSRRIIVDLWNAAGVKRAALPPCLCWYQFYVREENGFRYLDCQAMNRSSDIVVAGGWNVATAALFTYILATASDMQPGILTWIYGDAHIYLNNIDAAKKIVARTPRMYPKLFIRKSLRSVADIEGLEFSDLRLVNYCPVKPQIALQMNA